jgi:hypothetical protein
MVVQILAFSMQGSPDNFLRPPFRQKQVVKEKVSCAV